MKFYIDTNTFPTNPALYADAEKSKRIPQILPVVQLTRGAVQIGFLGENTPPDGALVEFSATIAGTNTQVVLARGEKTANGDAWEFNLNFNSEALSIALESKHADVMLIAGIIVSTDAFRQEWQLRLSASETATGELDPKQVESAKDFADVAERSAARSEEAARNAEQSAQDASESAEAAQASAEAAGKSQEAAAQSAKESAQSKTDAVSAKNAAETAKTDAEKAKTDAGAAKAGAERARDDANEILRNIESEAESVETAGEQALVEIETSKQEAKAEIEAFTDVYTKSEIDGITGAEVTLKMNETCAQLKDYEEVTGEKLPFDFWEAVMAEFQRWQENPTEVKEWVATVNADGTITSTCPYYETPPTKPVVDFNVTKAKGVSDGKALHSAFGECHETIFLPSATDVVLMLSSNQKANCDVIAPSATSVFRLIQNAQFFEGFVYCPKATTWSNFAQGAFLFNRPVTSQNGVKFYMAFYEARKYNQFTDMRSASSAQYAFYKSAMSAENISKTLDSLPTWTDGASHVITFTGSPGASELTQESPSVAAAVAKGWTVEL